MSNLYLIPKTLPTLHIQDTDSTKGQTTIKKRPLARVSPHLRSTALFDTSSASIQLSPAISSDSALHSNTHLSPNEIRPNYQSLNLSNTLKRQRLDVSNQLTISVSKNSTNNKQYLSDSLNPSLYTNCTLKTNPINPQATRSHHLALQIPEILSKVISYLDYSNGKLESGFPHTSELHNEVSNISNSQGPLFPCLLVNKQWNETANRILYRNLYFDTLDKWNCFNSKENNNDLSMIIITKKLVLSKLPLTGAVDAANITRLRGNIEWLEIYMCPSILPPLELFTSSLRNILLPGCALVNDSTLYAIGRNCPDLETLDLRACSRITDQGLKFIARTCLKLKTLNVGQTLNSRSGITHNSIKEIARYTSVTTLGVSGCAITDQTVWEIALYRGKNLERLSLNNCKLLTNESIPRILGYVPNLSVLEMRGCVNITNMRPVLEFKRFQLALGRTPLIEGCVVIKRRLQEMDWALTMEVSRDVLSHCIEWIYKADYDKNNWPNHSAKNTCENIV